MINSIFLSLYHITEQRRQIRRIGWGSPLVCHNSQFIMALPQAEHGFDKVIAIFAKDPGNADDEIFYHLHLHSLLSKELGQSVHIQRPLSGICSKWLAAFSIKDVVCGNVKHLRIDFFSSLCESQRSFGINIHGPAIFIFRLVHGCISSTVNDSIRVIRSHYFLHFRWNSQVHIFGTDAFVFDMTSFQFLSYVITKLPSHSCYKNFHYRYTPLLVYRYRLSAALSIWLTSPYLS